MVIYDKKAAQAIDRIYQTPEIINQRLQTLNGLALRNGESVLDVGCGTGLLLQMMSGEVGDSGQITGLDLSADMLEIAKQRCGELANVRLLQGSADELEFEADYFDVVACTQTLLYVEQVEQALREISRVLKPGGRVAVVETDWRGLVLSNSDNDFARRIVDAWDIAVVSPNLPVKLIPLLKQVGFSEIRVTPIPVLNTSYDENNYSTSILQWFVKAAVRQGVITQQESDQWLAQMEQLSKQDAYFFCVNRFLFTAVK